MCDWWFNVDCSLAESLYTRQPSITHKPVLNRFQTWSKSVPIQPGSNVPNFCITFSYLSPNLFQTCSQPVPDLFTTFSKPAQNLFQTRFKTVTNLSRTCSKPFSNLFKAALNLIVRAFNQFILSSKPIPCWF